MKPGRVRAIAIVIIHRSQDGGILVFEGHDPLKKETFYRPLGGTIEFGEHSRRTVERELREEIGAEVVGLEYLATIENIFVYNGETGHEIVLIYTGDLADPALYQRETMVGHEDNGVPFRVLWKGLGTFGPAAPLYRTGLLDLLNGPGSAGIPAGPVGS